MGAAGCPLRTNAQKTRAADGDICRLHQRRELPADYRAAISHIVVSLTP
jgi:hypothetical protein